MQSVITICNLALAHLGDRATVVAIDPPEGSAQAEHCARFYPLARDALLEAHPWNFATRRERLALLAHTDSVYRYRYAMPNDALSVIAIQPQGVSDDYEQGGRMVPKSLFIVFLCSRFPRKKSCMQGENARKVGHLASIFNAADAVFNRKYGRNGDFEQALRDSKGYLCHFSGGGGRYIRCSVFHHLFSGLSFVFVP